jgi:hypothetical protein
VNGVQFFGILEQLGSFVRHQCLGSFLWFGFIFVGVGWPIWLRVAIIAGAAAPVNLATGGHFNRRGRIASFGSLCIVAIFLRFFEQLGSCIQHQGLGSLFRYGPACICQQGCLTDVYINIPRISRLEIQTSLAHAEVCRRSTEVLEACPDNAL